MTDDIYDVAILGTGSAGLQAAMHAGRRKVSVLVLGKLPKSSAYNAHIENYCCIHGGTGSDFLKLGQLKAEEAGVNFLDEDATGISADNSYFLLHAEREKSFQAKSVIFAMGMSGKKLELKEEKKFFGRGINYCVDCDAGLYKGKNVAVAGCESAALSGALTLLFYANEVHLTCEKLDTSDYLIEKIKESHVLVHEGRRIVQVLGDESVKGIELDDGPRVDISGVFIELGAKVATTLAGNLDVAMDEETMKYIATNKKQETNISGVYAAGDTCCPPWQVAKAIGEGCVAGLEAAAYSKNIKKNS